MYNQIIFRVNILPNYELGGIIYMSKRGVGFGFIALAVLTFCIRYLSAAIFVSESEIETMSGIQSVVQSSLQYVNTPLTEISIILGLIGLSYLIWSEMEQRLQKKA
jgi:Na+-transporting methylmalonyl-CoA/oxaloacetate decarboxylase gamma subunit